MHKNSDNICVLIRSTFDLMFLKGPLHRCPAEEAQRTVHEVLTLLKRLVLELSAARAGLRKLAKWREVLHLISQG